MSDQFQDRDNLRSLAHFIISYTRSISASESNANFSVGEISHYISKH
jgi:hypothetical protein